MRKLKRSECAVLTLVLKGKWYDMIEGGEKREEYRDSTPYWATATPTQCESTAASSPRSSTGCLPRRKGAHDEQA